MMPDAVAYQKNFLRRASDKNHTIESKNLVNLVYGQFGHNLSLIQPLLQTKLWLKQLYIRASGTTQLPLHTNPLARADCHFKQNFASGKLVSRLLVQIHWLKQTTTSN
jgi:hypothetical protein